MAATTSEMALERLDLDDKTEIEADDWAEPPLRANLGLLSPAQKELAHMLVEQNQKHLFAHWPELGVEDYRKVDFFNQVEKLNVSYPGGLKAYISNARKLLADSKAGKNPFEGYTPLVPAGESLTYGDEKFINFEEAGLKEACKAAFVLVAGGLGERLGYNGIKVALPSEITTRTCFLHLYIESILALQNASLKITAGISTITSVLRDYY
ncbi:hypothetical protein O6H91_17G014900 [Diphasiastrum complanatum]|uniref:Uncharacterized protein n=1 Tax=Diphasiastrum complanatum TaxID=34168 RepID=A0ACC2B4G7_DIPCM|nr:hypothetical protein O6H91_17G014900 [Diphasiastrum complanatum]